MTDVPVRKAPVWATRWLWAAGIYNLLWGAAAIAWPNLLFDLAGIERINYPDLTNDLIWWVPFAMILWDAAIHHRREPRPAAACQRYVKENRIAAPPEVVFRFHETSDALTHLIRPWENMKVAESASSLAPGSKVVLRGRVGLLPIEWGAVHTEYDPPRLFADRQEARPFAWWYHWHHFVDDSQGARSCGTRSSIRCRSGRWGAGWAAG